MENLKKTGEENYFVIKKKNIFDFLNLFLKFKYKVDGI